jgi:hypothetical protein
MSRARVLTEGAARDSRRGLRGSISVYLTVDAGRNPFVELPLRSDA